MSETATTSDMEVEVLPIEKIRPYHRNPRDHEGSVEHVEDSIRKFGFRVPVVVDDENVLVAGHGRFKGVQRLEGELSDRIHELLDNGREDLAQNLRMVNSGRVLAIRETELDRHTISEFRIADNKITELSDWNEAMLQTELEKIDDPSQTVGFTEQELEGMLDDFELDIDDEKDEEDDFEFELPESGGTGVELRCPDCLESFEVSAEIVRMELNMMTDDDEDEPTEDDE